MKVWRRAARGRSSQSVVSEVARRATTEALESRWMMSTTYYVSPSGDDGAAGTSPAAATMDPRETDQQLRLRAAIGRRRRTLIMERTPGCIALGRQIRNRSDPPRREELRRGLNTHCAGRRLGMR